MQLVVEVTRNAHQVKCATITSVKIHVKLLVFVDRMPFVNLQITLQCANVQLASKEIQHQNKDVCVYRLYVRPAINALLVICALPINVMYHAQRTSRVPLENDVRTICAQRFATQTITVYQEKFAMIRELVNQDALQMVIVRQHKFVFMINVNVVLVSLLLQLVVLILMNVLNPHVTEVQNVKILLVRSVVYALVKQ